MRSTLWRRQGVGRLLRVEGMLLAAALVGALAQASEPVAIETWSSVELTGTPVGWMHYTEVSDEAGGVTVTTETRMTMMRAGTTIEAMEHHQSYEDAQGALQWMEVRRQMAGSDLIERWDFKDGQVTVRAGEGERQITSTVSAADCLAPAAGRRQLDAAIDAGLTRVALCVVDGSSGPAGSTSTYEKVGPTDVITEAGSVAGTAWELTGSGLGGAVAQLVLDADGVMLAMRTDMVGLQMVVRPADASVVSRPPGEFEAMVSTLIHPDKAISDPRRARYLRLRISGADDKPPHIPTVGVQRATTRGSAVDLVIDMAAVSPAVADAAALGRSVMVDGEDPRIVTLAGEAAPPGASPVQAAEDLRAFVHRYIVHKGLDRGLASASQVAEERRGDCTEHAVLLAALLRARGIPSRVAAGVVYVDDFAGQTGVFGYHMWTQAWLEIDGVGRWVDHDAALSPSIPFDATHIVLATSTMADGTQVTDLANMLAGLGRLSVEVLKVKHGR